MMKWTRLQLNKLPIIAIEADGAIERLEELVQRVNLHAHHDDIENLNHLREAIINRIEALDRFYEQNYLDSTISIFHMIKLKLKKAIFKVPNIFNETIEIEMLTPEYNRSMDSFSKIAQQSNRKLNQNSKTAGNFKIEKKSKSKSKSKLKNKDNILKLLETSRREQEETNLMEEVDFREMHYFDNSFDLNRNDEDEPLFNSHQPHVSNTGVKDKGKPQLKQNNKIGEKKDKSLSPFAKKPIKNPNPHPNPNPIPSVNENIKNISPKINNTVNNIQQKNKTNPKQNYSTVGNFKLNSEKSSKQLPNNKIVRNDVSKKLKTQGEEIRISEQEKGKQDAGEFRFTIKMTKQQYLSLLKMKQMLKNEKIQ